MKTFKINDKYEITCTSEKTRYGFRHLANLYRTGLSGTTVLVEKAKECYYNRTWESLEYETVINNLLTKAKIMPEEQIKEFLECCRKDNLEEVNKQFGFIAGIAKLGEILCNTQSEVNDWKERMIKAGLGDRGLIMPDDWHRLSEDEKERRLNGVINELSK
jgi:hypothetical protein